MSMKEVLERAKNEAPVTPAEVANYDGVNKSEDEIEEILRDLVNGDSPFSEYTDLEESDVNFED